MRKHFQSGFKKMLFRPFILKYSICKCTGKYTELPHVNPWWLRWWRICLQCGRPSLTPVLRRFPGGGHGHPPQYSCLENPPGTEEPDGLLSMGLQRVGHDWATFTSTARNTYTSTPLSPSSHSPSCIRPVFLTLTLFNSLVLSGKLFFFSRL